MLAVIPLVSLTDDGPRQLSVRLERLSALSCWAWRCTTAAPRAWFGALAGMAMAGMHARLRRSRMASRGPCVPASRPWFKSSFTIGASLSSCSVASESLLGWRRALMRRRFSVPQRLDSLGGVAARGFLEARKHPQPLLDFRPVLANRDVPRPDRRLRRGHLGLRRLAAVDRRLSYVLCR